MPLQFPPELTISTRRTASSGSPSGIWKSTGLKGDSKISPAPLYYNDQHATKSTADIIAKIESVDTRVAPRDAHLKTLDFFDAAAYPEMKFVSTRIEKNGKEKYVLHGDLTMKGVTNKSNSLSPLPARSRTRGVTLVLALKCTQGLTAASTVSITATRWQAAALMSAMK